MVVHRDAHDLCLRAKAPRVRDAAQNPVNGFVFDEPVIVKGGGTFHPIVHFARRLTIKAKRRRSIRAYARTMFHPAAYDDVSPHLRLFRSVSEPEAESAAVADSKDIDLICVDEVVIFQRAKCSAITGQFRFKIIFGTIAFAVTDTLFVHTKKEKPGSCAIS